MWYEGMQGEACLVADAVECLLVHALQLSSILEQSVVKHALPHPAITYSIHKTSYHAGKSASLTRRTTLHALYCVLMEASACFTGVCAQHLKA